MRQINLVLILYCRATSYVELDAREVNVPDLLAIIINFVEKSKSRSLSQRLNERSISAYNRMDIDQKIWIYKFGITRSAIN